MFTSVLLNVQEIRKWNNRKLVPKSVAEHEDVLWNQGVQTEMFWQIGQT
jgi:hypothetical protein